MLKQILVTALVVTMAAPGLFAQSGNTGLNTPAGSIGARPIDEIRESRSGTGGVDWRGRERLYRMEPDLRVRPYSRIGLAVDPAPDDLIGGFTKLNISRRAKLSIVIGAAAAAATTIFIFSALPQS